MTECQAQNQRQVDDPNSIPYMVAYKPAAGYYICPEEGLVCTIVNCWEEEGCDDFMFKFDRVPNVINRDDEEVFVSMGEHSSITLAYGDAEMIICDSRCTCQSLIADGDGCQLAPPTEVSTDAFYSSNNIYQSFFSTFRRA